MRPLAWVGPARCAGSSDVFLLGEDVLVAPVLEEGAHVTAGARCPTGVWFHGETGERVQGSIELAVGPDDMPWFVRAGAVVPTRRTAGWCCWWRRRRGRGRAGGRLLTDAGDGWDRAARGALHDAMVDGEVVVTREVVVAGAFGFSGVEVRALEGGPARLA